MGRRFLATDVSCKPKDPKAVVSARPMRGSGAHSATFRRLKRAKEKCRQSGWLRRAGRGNRRERISLFEPGKRQGRPKEEKKTRYRQRRRRRRLEKAVGGGGYFWRWRLYNRDGPSDKDSRAPESG